jgi:carboxylesterase
MAVAPKKKIPCAETGKTGCLLIHGFTGSPRELKGLQQYLESVGIATLAVTLPGHDTDPADMFDYDWQDWYAGVREEFYRLKQDCESVFVCGQSMGGTLALLLAARVELNGVITLSAPVYFPLWQQAAVRFMIPGRTWRYKKDREDIREVTAKNQLNSYARFPYYAVDQLFRLVRKTRSVLAAITQPILIIHSFQDHTIPIRNARRLYASVSSADKTRIDLQKSYHVVAEDVEKEFVWQSVANFITRNA